MRVSEIFYSIEGEGKRAGLPCVFVRFHGCNLHCNYCDSRYACEGDDYGVMTHLEVIHQILQHDCNRVTLTGGEPLLQPGMQLLLRNLDALGCSVNVETNGTQPLLHHGLEHVFYTVDYKTHASGESHRMNPETFESLQPKDVLKFVVGSIQDLEQAIEVVEKYQPPCAVYVSPVFGKIDAASIVAFIKKHKLTNWRVQLQLHKYIWEPTKRGV